MKKIITLLLVVFTGVSIAQVNNTDTITNEPLNSAANIIAGTSSKRVMLGTYAQIDYNQQIGDTLSHNGKLDVHRLVMFLGYQFNKRTTFVSEIELEHVKEVFVEQAFLNYNINPMLNFRAGLLLIPMGIINEYHEPTTYNGVERPNIEGKIIPTTWREMGAGFAGKFDGASLRYQLYVVNGFNGYDGSGKFKGNDAMRGGRQKAAESYMSNPNLSLKLDYYGLPGLKVGLAGYFGPSQTKAKDGLLKSANNDWVDSTQINISMVGTDIRYVKSDLQARAMFTYTALGNTESYNTFTGKDLGSSMLGYYAEIGYNVMSFFNKDTEQKIVPFARYEVYNTHQTTAGKLTVNDAYNRTDITVGVGYWLARGAVIKGDYQLMTDKAGNKKQMLNFGVGVWF